MSGEEFKIRFDLICDPDFMKTANWRETEAAKAMASICRQKGLWKSIRYLYSELINSGTVGGDTWSETLKKDDWKRMKEELLSDLYCSGGNFYYLQAGDQDYLEEFSQGYNLCQPGIEIHPSHEAFNTLFAFRLNSTLDKVSFLDYHMANTFNNNWRVFSFRLIAIKPTIDFGNGEFINEYIKAGATHSINNEQKSLRDDVPTSDNQTSNSPNRRQAVKVTWEDLTANAAQLKNAIRTILNMNFANKTKRIVQVIAFMSAESKVNYNASAFADLFFNEFGNELGIRIDSLRKAISPSEIRDLEVNSQIKTLLKPLLV